MPDPASKAHLDHLERHLTGARKVGLFGHRNVGKTTLLAMFYRQASAGLVPGLRLAAPEAATAEYLAEKIARIESGEPPAGTLSETELKLRLYHHDARYDLIIKDYQGEHITLGSGEPIMEFFADCDAVLLCLDPEGSAEIAERRRRQQEVEHLLESYIDQSRQINQVDRPIAIVVTKYDMVLAKHGSEDVEALMEERYGMTLHAVRGHAARSAAFAVSAYGLGGGLDGKPPAELRPMGLEGPLLWIAEQLEAIDREQLEWIWDLAPDDLPRLKRCVAAFERRYPKSMRALEYRRRLRAMDRGRGWKRLTTAAVALVALAGGVVAYDWLDPVWVARNATTRPADANAEAYRALQRRHPHLMWYWPGQARALARQSAEWRIRAEEVRVAVGEPGDPDDPLAQLKQDAPDRIDDIAKIEAARDRRRHDETWRAIKADALLTDADPRKRLDALRAFLVEHPETDHLDEAKALAQGLRDQIAQGEARALQGQVADLKRQAALPNVDLADLLERANKLIAANPDSAARAELERLAEGFAGQLDERDYQKSVEYSRRYPTHFQTRVAKFESYIQSHQAGGRFVDKAMEARDQALREWDAHAYRQAYDQFRAHPEDVEEVARRLNDYLRDHADGRYVESAQGYLRWFEKVSQTGSYKVTLRRGSVDPKVGKSFSGAGPDLSVKVEVAGTTYGPTPVIPNTRAPIWDYTFPQAIAWKLGDPIAIRIIDNDWSDSVVFTLRSDPSDPLAMQLLSGTIRPSKGGDTRLVFESDFALPTLVAPEPAARVASAEATP